MNDRVRGAGDRVSPLPPSNGAIVEGPGVLEQPDATTIIDLELIGRVDRFGNVIIERAAG
jgi:hypothetical protein